MIDGPLKNLLDSRKAALMEIWQAKDALYEYMRTGQIEKAKVMAYRIDIYERVFEELWPPKVFQEKPPDVIPQTHNLSYMSQDL